MDEPFRISIDEAHRQVPHVLTDYERQERQRGYQPYSPPWDLAPSGQLRLHLTTPDNHAFVTLRDTPTKPLEIRPRPALHALLDHAYQEKRWGEEQSLREETEQERRRQEQILRERRQAHAKLIDELERQAGAWLRARFLRRYVLAARRALHGERIEVKLQNHSIDILDWAEQYVDQLDPSRRLPATPISSENARFTGRQRKNLSRTCYSVYSAATHNCLRN